MTATHLIVGGVLLALTVVAATFAHLLGNYYQAKKDRATPSKDRKLEPTK